MITIISGTNQPDSRTELVSDIIFELLEKYTDEEMNVVKLSQIDLGFIHPQMYSADHQHPELSAIQDKYMIPANKWILLTPEYNGSYSGMAKLFIDALSVRKYAQTFKGKKLGLVGIASGRAGNLRGLDHLTTAFNYLGMHVLPNRLPISSVESRLTDNKLNKETIKTLNEFLEDFVQF